MATSSARRSELRRDAPRGADVAGVAGAFAFGGRSAASLLGVAGDAVDTAGGANALGASAGTWGAGVATGSGLVGARRAKKAMPALATSPATIAETAGQPSPPPLAAAGVAAGSGWSSAPGGRRAPRAARLRARSASVGAS